MTHKLVEGRKARLQRRGGYPAIRWACFGYLTPMCGPTRWPPDALLGAIRGSSGKAVPLDTDPERKAPTYEAAGRRCHAKVRKEGFLQIIDVDSVTAAQALKMAPHRQQMRENLAAAMASRSITSREGNHHRSTGLRGSGEGISATAVALTSAM